MFIIQVWNPAACDRISTRMDGSDPFVPPFAGIEILGFADTEEGVNEMIDEIQGRSADLKFHYQTISVEMLAALTGTDV